MPALTLHVLPGWLYTIDENRVKPEAREDVIVFQLECTDALAEYFANKARLALPAPQSLVPAEPLAKPVYPGPNATWEERRMYYQDMLTWLDWKEEAERRHVALALAQRQEWLETRHDAFEDRMEGVEELSRLFVEVTERLGPQRLSPEHQAMVKQLARQDMQRASARLSFVLWLYALCINKLDDPIACSRD